MISKKYSVTSLNDLSITEDNHVRVYTRANLNGTIFTSAMYKKCKRNNFCIFWNNYVNFGIMQFFISANNVNYAYVRELVKNANELNIINPRTRLNFSYILMPVRLTYTFRLIRLNFIEEKCIYFHNYISVPPNMHEMKM